LKYFENAYRCSLAIADSKPVPTCAWIFDFGIDMNNELEEVVGQDVSDDAQELAVGGAQGRINNFFDVFDVLFHFVKAVLAIAHR